MIKAIQEINPKNLWNIKLKTEGPYEVKELSYAFNAMINSVQQYQQDLLENKKMMEVFYEQSVQLILLLDPSGRIVNINKTALQISGENKEKVLGQFFWDISLWRDSIIEKEKAKRSVQQVIDGQASNSEFTSNNISGEKIYIDYSLTPILGQNTEVIWIIVEGRNITEKKKLEIKRNRYFAFLDNLKQLNPRQMVHLRFEDYSSKILQILLECFDCERALLIRFSDIPSIIAIKTVPLYPYSETWDENLWKDALHLNACNSLMHSYEVCEINNQYRNDKHALYRSILLINIPVPKEGNFIIELHRCSEDYIFETFEKELLREIIEKVVEAYLAYTYEKDIFESENRIKDIVNNSLSLISLKNNDFRYIQVNRRFLDVLGLKEIDVLNKEDHEIFSPAVAQKVRNLDLEIFNFKKLVTCEEKINTTSGERYYQTTRFPLFDLQGHPYAVCAISTDITQQKGIEIHLEHLVAERTTEIEQKNQFLERLLNEQQLMQKRLVAQEKLASLGNIASGIAHEIKNPLNFVINSGRVIEQLLDNIDHNFSFETIDKQKESLYHLRCASQLITKHGLRVDEIIKRMINMSLPNESKLEMTYLDQLLDEAFQLSYQTARTRFPLTLTPFKNYQKTDAIYIYTLELKRALMNIFDNAFYALNQNLVQSTKNFIPQMAIALEVLNNNEILIKISDNGPGIPQEIASRIFDPFVTNKPAGEGVGLGLSIVFDIISKHHGEIGYQRENDQTIFWIKIPTHLDEVNKGNTNEPNKV